MTRRTTVVNIRGRDRAELLADTTFLYVGRGVGRAGGWKTSKWANPWRVAKQPYGVVRSTDVRTADEAVAFHAKWIRKGILYNPGHFNISELVGKRLGCWCLDWEGEGEPPGLCHAVELARLANLAIDNPNDYQSHLMALQFEAGS